MQLEIIPQILQEGDDLKFVSSRKIEYSLDKLIPFYLSKPIFVVTETYCKKGKWSDRESYKYALFLSWNKDKFLQKEERRLSKIFKLMSGFIKTRNPTQCRSHHQRMEIQYPNLLSIIQYSWIGLDQDKQTQIFKRYQRQLILYSNPTKFRIEQKCKDYEADKSISQRIVSLLGSGQLMDKNCKLNSKKSEMQDPTYKYTSSTYRESEVQKTRNQYDQQNQNDLDLNSLYKLNSKNQQQITNKKQQILSECHGYWLKYISAAIELESMCNLLASLDSKHRQEQQSESRKPPK